MELSTPEPIVPSQTRSRSHESTYQKDKHAVLRWQAKFKLCHRDVRVRINMISVLTTSEISNLNIVQIIKKYITGLDVSVNESFLVEIVYAKNCLLEKLKLLINVSIFFSVQIIIKSTEKKSISTSDQIVTSIKKQVNKQEVYYHLHNSCARYTDE